ncbi:MAG: PD40 domain-containing protein [Anaerolineae bacterium]|nr:PD40 domain-containing protein [Anaerolineae bacterium]
MQRRVLVSVLAFLLVLSHTVVLGQDSSTMIAFVGKRADNEDIFLTTQDNSITYNLTNARSRDWHPSWASDGARIAFSTDRDGNNEIYVMDANGENPRNVTTNPASDTSPDWSPESDEIAFVSDRDGGFDLYIADVATGTARRLTTDGQPKSDPDWSADGSAIAYWELAGQAAQLKVIDVASGTITLLLSEGQNQWPAWSPDRSRIAYFSTSANNLAAIRLYELASGNVEDLVSYSFNSARPEWSPDGSQLAFMSDRDGNFNIYIASADGLTLSRLTSNPEDDTSPAWQPRPAQLDFSNTALGQGVNVVQGTPDPALQAALGPGDATVYAPEQANVDDFITVRLQLDPQIAEGAPQPTPELPVHEVQSVEVYRFMGARLRGGSDFADKFDLFSPADYVIQVQEDGDNFWEWELFPRGTEAIGTNPFVIELYRPTFEENGAVIESRLGMFTFKIDVVDGSAAPSEYAISTPPDERPKIGFTVQYTSQEALSIVFTQSIDVSTMSIHGPNHPPFIPVQTFDALQNVQNLAQAGTCLTYIADDAAPVLISECQTQQTLLYELNLGDIFWFLRTRGGIQPVQIYLNGETYSCSQAIAPERCEF